VLTPYIFELDAGYFKLLSDIIPEINIINTATYKNPWPYILWVIRPGEQTLS